MAPALERRLLDGYGGRFGCHGSFAHASRAVLAAAEAADSDALSEETAEKLAPVGPNEENCGGLN